MLGCKVDSLHSEQVDSEPYLADYCKEFLEDETQVKPEKKGKGKNKDIKN